MQPDKKMTIAGLAAGAILVSAVVYSLPRAKTETTAETDVPASAATPAPSAPGDAVTLVYARPFKVQTPYRHVWRSDQPLIDQGWLVVLDAPRSMLTPTQLQEPVLYVGDQTAERIHAGVESGKVVALVPGTVDLSTSPIFYGDRALPERLRQVDIDRQLAAARARGVLPPSAERLDESLVGETLVVPDYYQLQLAGIDLVEQHMPEAADFVAGWRVPRVDGR